MKRQGTSQSTESDEGAAVEQQQSRQRFRLWSWIRAVERNPDLEARAAMERRARLLEDLNRAVADAPDDTPIADVVRRLNRHADD